MLRAWRDPWSHRRDKRPVFAPFCSLVDPALKGILVAGAECAFGFRRRHHELRIVAEDAPDQLAVVGVARFDHGDPVDFLVGSVAGIQPQFGFAGRAIWAVASVTVFRQNGLHFTCEIHLRTAGHGGQ